MQWPARGFIAVSSGPAEPADRPINVPLKITKTFPPRDRRPPCRLIQSRPWLVTALPERGAANGGNRSQDSFVRGGDRGRWPDFQQFGSRCGAYLRPHPFGHWL